MDGLSRDLRNIRNNTELELKIARDLNEVLLGLDQKENPKRYLVWSSKPEYPWIKPEHNNLTDAIAELVGIWHRSYIQPRYIWDFGIGYDNSHATDITESAMKNKSTTLYWRAGRYSIDIHETSISTPSTVVRADRGPDGSVETVLIRLPLPELPDQKKAREIIKTITGITIPEPEEKPQWWRWLNGNWHKTISNQSSYFNPYNLTVWATTKNRDEKRDQMIAAMKEFGE